MSLPGERKERLFCVLVSAAPPQQATEPATAEVRSAHPAATDIAEWLQRVGTPTTAGRIRSQMDAGTWPGWLEPAAEIDRIIGRTDRLRIERAVPRREG